MSYWPITVDIGETPGSSIQSWSINGTQISSNYGLWDPTQSSTLTVQIVALEGDDIGFGSNGRYVEYGQTSPYPSLSSGYTWSYDIDTRTATFQIPVSALTYEEDTSYTLSIYTSNLPRPKSPVVHTGEHYTHSGSNTWYWKSWITTPATYFDYTTVLTPNAGYGITEIKVYGGSYEMPSTAWSYNSSTHTLTLYAAQMESYLFGSNTATIEVTTISRQYCAVTYNLSNCSITSPASPPATFVSGDIPLSLTFGVSAGYILLTSSEISITPATVNWSFNQSTQVLTINTYPGDIDITLSASAVLAEPPTEFIVMNDTYIDGDVEVTGSITSNDYEVMTVNDISIGTAEQPTYTEAKTITLNGVNYKFAAGGGGGGASRYATTITGDGTATSFTVTHNLNKAGLAAIIYDSDGAQTYMHITFTSSNVLTLKTKKPIASGTVYSVVVIG